MGYIHRRYLLRSGQSAFEQNMGLGWRRFCGRPWHQKISHGVYTDAEWGSCVMDIDETEKSVVEHNWNRMVFDKWHRQGDRVFAHLNFGFELVSPTLFYQDSSKEWYQAFWGVLIDLIIGFLGLIINAFDNQTKSWAWLSSPLIIKLFVILDDNHDYFVYKTFTHTSNKPDSSDKVLQWQDYMQGTFAPCISNVLS
jgi:hypothetical protein